MDVMLHFVLRQVFVLFPAQSPNTGPGQGKGFGNIVFSKNLGEFFCIVLFLRHHHDRMGYIQDVCLLCLF